MKIVIMIRLSEFSFLLEKRRMRLREKCNIVTVSRWCARGVAGVSRTLTCA
jgi:hypothetical protein